MIDPVVKHRSARAALAAFGLCVLTFAAGCGGSSNNGPCGTMANAPATYEHVVWIWMENHSFGQIIGAAAAPYINGIANSCGLATNFHNTTHVSLPNYIGATTGLALADLQPFIFDCNPSTQCSTPADSLFAQVPSWKAYEESMTSNCQPTGLVGYAVRHNPPVYLTSLQGCPTYDVNFEQLQHDLDSRTLPAFSFITPNTVHDMHDGTAPVSIQAGDSWLQQNLPSILGSFDYRQGNTAVFITFDEGDGEMFGEDCAANPTDESCHIATIVISPSTPTGTTSDELFTHYSLLRTTEEMLGLSQFLGEAANAQSMRAAFHL
jgi:phospholipase C